MKKFNDIVRRAFHRSRDETSILFFECLRKVFAVALPILAVATTTTLAHAESIVGEISSVNGAVKIVRGAETLAATNGMAIRLHDKVVTEANGSVTIVMRDHSLLHLDQSGTLFIGKSTILNGFMAPSRPDCSSAQKFLHRGCYE